MNKLIGNKKTSNSINNPRFKPLEQASQGCNENVFYFDSLATREAKLECLTARLSALLGVLELLHEFDKPPAYALQKMGILSTIMLSNATSIIKNIQHEELTK
ncbi:hypothetical protein [Entomomonas asaccharolytica]|uniref:Uncharacterized protein n=1 Tax=Entomomonas asaccharolytica TaxID=2785331 RepID=A0A974NDK0_9GAMM|nr:hypothetical protein [Entomomonas asaccharolytica]QQP84533.1 hypothetical protein JHT90_08910 [Entomomonas asaccharolytica]